MSHQQLRGGTQMFSCDSCPEAVELEGSFQEALKEVREEGWTTFKMSGVYQHECPLCSREEV